MKPERIDAAIARIARRDEDRAIREEIQHRLAIALAMTLLRLGATR